MNDNKIQIDKQAIVDSNRTAEECPEKEALIYENVTPQGMPVSQWRLSIELIYWLQGTNNHHVKQNNNKIADSIGGLPGERSSRLQECHTTWNASLTVTLTL